MKKQTPITRRDLLRSTSAAAVAAATPLATPLAGRDLPGVTGFGQVGAGFFQALETPATMASTNWNLRIK